MADILQKRGYVLWRKENTFYLALVEYHRQVWDGQVPIYIACYEDGECGVVSGTPINKRMETEARNYYNSLFEEGDE